MSEQLALPYRFNAELGFREFHEGPNAELVQILKQSVMGHGPVCVFIWGDPGSGKTHLLNASCMEASNAGLTACVIPLDTLKTWSSESLDGLGELDMVCLDNLEAVTGDPAWENALFLLFNQLNDRQATLVVAAKAPPANLPFHLPDLQSRLCSGLIFRMLPLDDANKLLMLERKALALGLDLPPSVGRFMLTRSRRDLPSLIHMLEQLDQASLAAQRKLTIPFVKSILGEP